MSIHQIKECIIARGGLALSTKKELSNITIDKYSYSSDALKITNHLENYEMCMAKKWLIITYH
jgi:hypothetical protein